MPGTHHNLKYHLIFGTKHRRPFLHDAIRPRIHEYLGGIIRSERGHPIEIGGIADHVHILFSWRTDEALSVLARNLKANSSKWIHQTFADLREFNWQEGYAIFSVSESASERVREYIRGQEEHHRKKTFQEELVEFLRAHHVEYNEKYLWD